MLSVGLWLSTPAVLSVRNILARWSPTSYDRGLIVHGARGISHLTFYPKNEQRFGAVDEKAAHASWPLPATPLVLTWPPAWRARLNPRIRVFNESLRWRLQGSFAPLCEEVYEARLVHEGFVASTSNGIVRFDFGRTLPLYSIKTAGVGHDHIRLDGVFHPGSLCVFTSTGFVSVSDTDDVNHIRAFDYPRGHLRHRESRFIYGHVR